MKLVATLSSAVIATALSLNAAAIEPANDREALKGLAKFTGGALVGGLVGGPFGMFLGATGGGLFAEEGFKRTATENEVARIQENAAQLEREIAMQEAKIIELEEETLARLELKVFFDTGIDQVTDINRSRVRAIAEYLHNNPQIRVRLDGHADPRGTDEYNNVLAHERALTVKQILIEQGIADDRVSVQSHGADRSRSLAGDLDSYAKDRRVDIALELPPAQQFTSTSHSLKASF